jgi:hypothetical protein
MSTKSPDFNFLQAAIAGLSERRCPAESLAPSTDRDRRDNELYSSSNSGVKEVQDRSNILTRSPAAADEDFEVCCIMDEVGHLGERSAGTKISEPLRE